MIFLWCFEGRLALKFLNRKNSLSCKSNVMCIVYATLLWPSEPLQSAVSAYLDGKKAGQLSGDVFYHNLNWQLSITTSFVAGHHLDTVMEDMSAFIHKMQSQNTLTFSRESTNLLLQTICLQEGSHPDSNLTENEVSEKFKNNASATLGYKIHQLMRAFLFRQLETLPHDAIKLSDIIYGKKHPLRTLYVMGLFYEGLSSFQLARHTKEDATTWIAHGDSILANVKMWSEHSLWNWENKALLLEAEKMHSLGHFDVTGSLYERAIRSAHDHKFVHEEGIASELAGMFHHGRRHRQQAHEFLLHSVECYKKWGAHAVAKRVKTFIATNYPPEFTQQKVNGSASMLENLLATNVGYDTKKLHERI